jgi:hypothetical protein
MNIFVFSCRYLYVCLFIFNCINGYFINSEDRHNVSSINSFAFGSCYNGINKHKSRYDIFDTIHKNKPDLFIWLGDAAYIRYYKEGLGFFQRIKLNLFNKWRPINSTRIEKKFNQTKFNTRN